MRWKMKSFNFRCKRTINIAMIAKVLKFAFKNTSVQNWSDASTTIAISTYWIVRIECTYLIYLLTESTDHSYCIGWLHKKTARWLYLMAVNIELALQLYTLLILTECTYWLYLLILRHSLKEKSIRFHTKLGRTNRQTDIAIYRSAITAKQEWLKSIISSGYS